MIHRAIARQITLRLAALAAVAALGACISLFPKATPSQLYRFDAAAQSMPAAGGGPAIAVRAAMIEFDPAAAGDRILTVDGDQVAYVQDGRWAVPASQMFQEALTHGFHASGLRLVDIGEASQAKLRLRLQVTHFEARYLSGPKAAPTVVVTVRATLDRDNGVLVAEQPFEASVPAGDNRLGAIVAAYDEAVSKVVGQLAAWIGQSGTA
jgi:cholesterol transport system auxiliary component